MPKYDFFPSLERASISDYVTLFERSFSSDDKLTFEYLNWLYCLNPHGMVIGWDAFYEGRLVAHYAVIPRKYDYIGHEFIGTLSVNTATDPGHQGKGLFIKLAGLTYEAAYKAGASFVVGVANGNSVGGFKGKLDFSVLGQVKLYLGYRKIFYQERGLNVLIDGEWVDWRISNPSRNYSYMKDGDVVNLRTHIKGVPFNLGCLEKTLFEKNNAFKSIKRANRFIPGITPFFRKDYESIACLPTRFQPSPWWVIWRSLDKNIPSELAENLQFNGLSMDTF